MKNFLARFVRDESGATSVEYGLIAALIAVAIIGAARALGTQIGTTFNTVVTDTQNSGGGSGGTP
jgi:pilus assembly protein Flp/PilA